jgi:hypothetical protein
MPSLWYLWLTQRLIPEFLKKLKYSKPSAMRWTTSITATAMRPL